MIVRLGVLGVLGVEDTGLSISLECVSPQPAKASETLSMMIKEPASPDGESRFTVFSIPKCVGCGRDRS